MTNVLDGMAILPPVNITEKCPICGKAPHPDKTTTDKKEEKGCLKSVPANLGCKALNNNRDDLPNFTTAAHHLIPANQCLKRFPRLSQMAATVGYDVNNKENGIALPTCAQGDLNRYESSSGKLKKYGRLSQDDKKNVAFYIMKGVNGQWHVGHHNWKIKVDNDTDNQPHHPNYDKLVKEELKDLELELCEEGESICEPEEGESGEDVIKALNGLSQEINENVESWKLFFVSRLAYEYGKECK